MKKLVLLTGIFLIVISMMGGCAKPTESGDQNPQESNESPETPKTEVETKQQLDLEIIESGWFVDSNGYVHYGIGIKNPNSSYEIQFPTIEITGKDGDGKIVFSESQVLNFMFANAELYYGGQTGNGTAPETVEFNVSVPSHGWVENDKQAFEIYTISNTNYLDSDGRSSFTGEITANTEWDDVESAMVNVILRDNNDKIIFGDFSFVDNLNEGETKSFEISSYDIPEFSTFEIHAQPW